MPGCLRERETVMRKIIFAVSLLIVFLSACSANKSTDFEQETQPAEMRNEQTSPNVQNQSNADGYDILEGLWEVGAVYHEGKVVDVHDNDALAAYMTIHSLNFTEAEHLHI